MNGFTKAINTVIDWIGNDRQSGNDQRTMKVQKKTSKRKTNSKVLKTIRERTY
jgi:hypothetical protein